MTTQTDDQTPTLAELEARLAAGEPVDPDEWMRARALAELADLRARAEREAAEREAEARRLAEIRQVRDDVLAAAADVEHDDADIALIAEAAERIIRRHQRLADVVRDARTRLARLGVPERRTVEGIRWRQAGMGYADSVEVDGRTISIIATPGRPIAAALDDACRRAGINPHLLGPFVQLNYTRPPTPEERQARERAAAAARAAALARIAAGGAGQ